MNAKDKLISETEPEIARHNTDCYQHNILVIKHGRHGEH